MSVIKTCDIFRVYRLIYGQRFVCIDLENCVVYSVYISPSKKLKDFNDCLDELSASLKTLSGKRVIIGGDFNAKNKEWGGETTDPKGEALADFFAQRGLLS